MEHNAEMKSVLRRVQKLLAIANDDRANANEAAAAAAQAENIMRKYQIEHADVLRAEILSGAGEFDTADVVANMKRDDLNRTPLKVVPKWAQGVAIKIARLNDCEVRLGFMNRVGKEEVRDASLRFYGFKSDVQVASWMFDFIVNSLICAQREWSKRTSLRGKVEAESFRDGFAMTVMRRLEELRMEREAAMNAPAPGTAEPKAGEQPVKSAASELVVVKKSAIADHFGDFKYNTYKSHKQRNHSAMSEGRQAGERVNINARGISGNGSQTLQLGGGKA